MLSKKDKRLLHELDFGARQSAAQIAKKIGVSKAVANYRIKRLEEEGIIKGYYPVLDLAKIGYAFFRVLLRFQNLSPEKEEEIIEHIRKHPSLAWLATLEGGWDVVLVLWAKNTYEFKKDCDRLLGGLAHHIREKYVTVATKIHHFKRNYLYDTKDYDNLVFGDYEHRKQLDSIDYDLLLEIFKNARVPLVQVAHKLGMTANAVSYRLKNLEKEGIILGYRASIDVKKLGYQSFKVFLYTENLTEQNKASLIEYLQLYPNAVYVTEAIGKSDFEFEVHLENNTELYQFMKNMRSEFQGIIADYEIILTYEEHQINYLPAL